MRETFDHPKADGIRYEGEHDRYRQSALLECDHRWRSDRDDHIRFLRSDLCDKSAQPISVSFSAQKLNLRGAVILVAKFAERLKQQMDGCAVRKAAVENDDLRRLPCEGRGSQGEG